MLHQSSVNDQSCMATILIAGTNFFDVYVTVQCMCNDTDGHTGDGIHRNTYGSDSDSLQNTTGSSILPESTQTSSGTDTSGIIFLSLSGKSGAKSVSF